MSLSVAVVVGQDGCCFVTIFDKGDQVLGWKKDVMDFVGVDCVPRRWRALFFGDGDAVAEPGNELTAGARNRPIGVDRSLVCRSSFKIASMPLFWPTVES